MSSHPVFAAVYERLLDGNEKAGLTQLRADLLKSARGRTLEVGAGTGLNLPHYGDAVTDLFLAEPDPAMVKRLRARLESGEPGVPRVELVEAPAERLPFGAGEFDTVVATLVLCSVDDPPAAVAEIQRVLAPGGRFLYIEHVRDEEGTRRARWQDRLDRPWGVLMGGCHPNRDSGKLIAAAFGEAAPAATSFPGPGSALIRPLVSGQAELSRGAA